MKRFIFPFALALAFLPLPARADATFGEYSAVLDGAKQAGRDFVVFYEGPSWQEESSAVARELNGASRRDRLPKASGWAAIPAGALAEEEAKKLKVKPDFTPYNLPALALVDGGGRTYAVAEGLTPANLPQALESLAAAGPARERRDGLWEKAKAASGAERAKLFGQGLDQMDFRFARGWKDILAEIQKADPSDASGYGFKYTFHAATFHEKTTGPMLEAKKQDELIALVEKNLANPVLAPWQKQALLTAKMQACRSRGDTAGAVATLKQVVAIDPKSELGTGAVDYIRILTEPVKLKTRNWEANDNRPVWLPMVVDVSDVVKEPGTYEIEFKHAAGHTRFRKVALRSGDKEIVADANAGESRKVRLQVSSVSRARAIELWAESMGTGWFEGRGEIVVTKVS